MSLRWQRRWMKLAHNRRFGKFASRMARLGVAPLYGRLSLVRFHPKGFFSPDATIYHPGFSSGEGCYLADGVNVYQDADGGAVSLGDGVQLHENNTLQTGAGGTISIGSNTHVQPRCQFSAYLGSIAIGDNVEIAPQCAFYPYNHGMEPNELIQEQPLTSKAGIRVGDGAWLGYGAILLDGASVGRGAVVAAGAVVSGQIPDMAIAAGAPARIVGTRLREASAVSRVR